MAWRFRRTMNIASGSEQHARNPEATVQARDNGRSPELGQYDVYVNTGWTSTTAAQQDHAPRGPASTRSSDDDSSADTTRITGYEHVNVVLRLADDGTIQFKDDKGRTLPADLERQAREQGRSQIEAWLEKKCNQINRDIDKRLRIHLDTPPPDTKILFNPKTFQTPPPEPPVEEPYHSPPPESPRIRRHSFLDMILPFLGRRVVNWNRRALDQFEQEVNQWKGHQHELKKVYRQQYQRYEEQLKEWQQKKDAFEDKQERRRWQLEEGRHTDPKAMAHFLADRFKTIDLPWESPISFQLEEDGRRLMLDVALPPIDEIPTRRPTIDWLGLRIRWHERSIPQVRQDYMAFVHSIGFFLIGQAFVSLPTAETVVLSAFLPKFNETTAQAEDEYLYSTRVERGQWQRINFDNLDRLDIVACFRRFESRRDVTQTGIFRPIEPYEA